MIIEEEDLPLHVSEFFLRLKNKYEFDDLQAITHMVDLIERNNLEFK